MNAIEIKSPLAEILKKVGEIPEQEAISLIVRGVNDIIKECEQEILQYEIKYGISYSEFKEKIEKGELGDKFSYELEKDNMRWSDLISEKRFWLNIIKSLKELK